MWLILVFGGLDFVTMLALFMTFLRVSIGMFVFNMIPDGLLVVPCVVGGMDKGELILVEGAFRVPVSPVSGGSEQVAAPVSGGCPGRACIEELTCGKGFPSGGVSVKFVKDVLSVVSSRSNSLVASACCSRIS